MVDVDTPPPAEEPPATLIASFKLDRMLNQDQAGRRISLLGRINDRPALLIAERAAFATDAGHLYSFASSLRRIQTLGHNDIYSWHLASSACFPDEGNLDSKKRKAHSGEVEEVDNNDADVSLNQPPDLKLNLIYPCTEKHIKKYSAQMLRVVTETPEVYRRYVHPWVVRMREAGRLDWVFNIIEGRKEQEDVVYREHGEEGFLLLPDLNWDRKTITSLHLLGIIERRDIWSIRDLKRQHIVWLKHMRHKLLESTVKLYPELEPDQLKLYLHYQPTYHHLHIHIVHVMLDAGATQATGKALGMDNIISQLEGMRPTNDQDDLNRGMADVNLTYTLGEESELWKEVFSVLKDGGEPFQVNGNP